MKDKNFIKLVERAVKGDTSAFQEIYKQKWKQIHFIAYEMTSDFDKAQDAAQEVFIKVFKNISKLENPETFNVWLNRIIRNTFIDMHKLSGNKIFDEYVDIEDHSEQFEEETDDFLPQNFLEKKEGRENLFNIIKTLDDDYRLAILMFYYEQMSCKEISEVSGISTGAVKMRLKRARDYIKDKLERLNGKGGTLLALVPLNLFSVILEEEANRIFPDTMQNISWDKIVEALAAGGTIIASVASGTTKTISGVLSGSKAAVTVTASVLTVTAAIVIGVYASNKEDIPDIVNTPAVSVTQTAETPSRTTANIFVPETLSTESPVVTPIITSNPRTETPRTNSPTPSPTVKPETPTAVRTPEVYPDNTLEGILGMENAQWLKEYIKKSGYEIAYKLEDFTEKCGITEAVTYFSFAHPNKYILHEKAKGNYVLYICEAFDDSTKSYFIDYIITDKTQSRPEWELWGFETNNGG